MNKKDEKETERKEEGELNEMPEKEGKLEDEKTEEPLGVDSKDEKIIELTENWKRALADYQNLKKRCEKEKEDFILYANKNLLLKLISVLDHLERVYDYLKDSGLEIALKEFKRILEEEGLSEIDALGKEFNPEEMEAVEIVKEGEENKVAEVISKGYRLKGKVIRAAKVKVFK